ncbi:hypothetical protein NBCG_00327 [Nocardioidaceae bacterium Broad-1]|nr:hypothetical protein NBCG_00327 [Nocardioidaceae bacterium Broad-1]
MTTTPTYYLIASAAGVDNLLDAMAALEAVGIATASFVDYETSIPALLDADAVVLVDGWESSPGARSQAELATAFGKTVLAVSDLLAVA